MTNSRDSAVADVSRPGTAHIATSRDRPALRRLAALFAIGAIALTASPLAGADGDPQADSQASQAALSPEAAESLRDLFDEGLVVGPKRRQAAQKHLAAARRALGDDPRLEYAWGLVLVKQAQLKQAAGEFEKVIERDSAYWPAWQALIWSRLVDRQYDKALAQLDEFAALVQKGDGSDEVTEPQRVAVRWMGEVLESLDKTLTAKKQRELLARHEEHLRDLLNDDLSEALEAGRELARERHFDLTQQGAIAEGDRERKEERRRQGRAAKLEKELADLDKDKEKAARTAEEWKKWLDETLGKVDKQLGLLERDYQFLDKRAESLRQSILLLGREITALEVNAQGATNAFTAGDLQQRQSQLQNQFFNYQLEYNATITRLMQVSRDGNAVLQQRAGIVQRYEKATGELVKKNAELDKWTNRVTTQHKKVEAAPAKGKAAAKTAKKRPPASFATYVSLDFELEKQRVLDSFGVQPAAAPSD